MYKEHVVYSTANNIIFTILQKSPRFELLKCIAVYIERKYLGTYRIADREIFRVKDLSEIHSLQFFGQRKPQGILELKKLSIKGTMSDNTEMVIVALEWMRFDEKHNI